MSIFNRKSKQAEPTQDVTEQAAAANEALAADAAPMLPADAVLQEERRPRRWPTVLLALLVLMVGAYLAGAIAFMRMFLPNTTINGQDVSLKTIEEVAEDNSASVSSFHMSVSGDGVDLSIGASDIKASYDGGGFARSAIAQQRPWSWPLELLSGTHEINVESRLSYDVARLDDIVGSAIDALNKDATKPADAKIVLDKKTKRYKIKPEVLGDLIDKSAALKAVRAGMAARQESVELGEEVLERPSVLSDDKELNETVERVNGSLDATQQLVTHDQTVYTVTEEDLEKWLKVDKKYKVTFDTEACTKWARGELSEKLDSIGSTRTFSLPDGREITVSGGTYGWSINGAEVAERIAENVLAGKQADIELTFLYTAESWNPGGKEWGDTFIEIDLGAQHVRLYEGDKVTWEADCVSGGMNTGKMHYTPTGVFYINSNMTSGNVELKGPIDPATKKPEYISYVKYWMPFLDNSHALHDADWRSEFGGQIYQVNGSHGCVNLPPDKAAELYGMVKVGTVVIIHD